MPPFLPETGTLLSALQTFPLTGELPFRRGKADNIFKLSQKYSYGIQIMVISKSETKASPERRGGFVEDEDGEVLQSERSDTIIKPYLAVPEREGGPL